MMFLCVPIIVWRNEFSKFLMDFLWKAEFFKGDHSPFWVKKAECGCFPKARWEGCDADVDGSSALTTFGGFFLYIKCVLAILWNVRDIQFELREEFYATH